MSDGLQIIVILMLSHKEPSQPKLWDEWLKQSRQTLSENQKLVFYVHTLQELCPTDFYESYGLGLKFGSTSWCSPSIVYEYLKALCDVVKNPEIRHAKDCLICLVSGDDIPIANGSFLFTDDIIKQDNIPSVQGGGGHSQWIWLTRDTAMALVQQYLIPNSNQFMHIFLNTLQKRIEDETYKKCLDETFLYDYHFDDIYRTANHKRRTENWKLNRMGPIEWEDWASIYPLERGRMKGFFTLEQAILIGLLINQELFFFRKVMSSVDCASHFGFFQFLWSIPRPTITNLAVTLLGRRTSSRQMQGLRQIESIILFVAKRSKEDIEKDASLHEKLRNVRTLQQQRGRVLAISVVENIDRLKHFDLSTHHQLIKINNFDYKAIAQAIARQQQRKRTSQSAMQQKS